VRLRRSRPRPSADHPESPMIVEVRDGSACAESVRVGDLLVEINGKRPQDILDYFEACDGSRVSLRLLREGREIVYKLRKDPGTPLGLVFGEAVFDGVRSCRNRCIFCFVDQMPPGLRPSLYIKDDDYRLSFYYGNFITLNNVTRRDMERIRRLRLSPLYVSLHSTDPGMRSQLMGGNAARGLEALGALLDAGIEIHLQVVACPDINDGEELLRTLHGVLEDYPAASLGVVPVGLTSQASVLPQVLTRHDRQTAIEVLDAVEAYQSMALDRYGRRIFYAADEFYLMAGRDFPPQNEYDGYPQMENGIGMARCFLEQARTEADAQRRDIEPARGVLTGIAGESIVRTALELSSLNGVEVVSVDNMLLGGTVTVTSLLGGGDIMAALSSRGPVSRELLIPDSMLRDGSFIDDRTPDDVERATGYRLVPVEVNGAGLLRALCEERK
jgi:putative radical SAM enzyme (TIGR03279 family)